MSMWGISQARKELVAGILLDRDGTIIEDYHYVGLIERVQLKPGAAEAIRRFNEAGIPVAIVTNQSGVARGFYPEANVNLVHNYIADELGKHGAHIDLFFYSPHHPDGNIPEYTVDTPFHKPAPGMAFRASAALGLDLKKSWVIGDRPEDVIMSYHIGANCVYLGGDLDTWSGDARSTLHPYPFNSLADAAGFIIERITGVSQDVFPTVHYPSAISYFNDYSIEIRDVLDNISLGPIKEAADIVDHMYTGGSSIFIAGNGGAAAIADHFETDLVKHMSTDHGWLGSVYSLNANNSIVTAIANDIGYDSVFSYHIERKATRHDLLIVFSVSGNSANIVRALQCASEMGMATIAVVASDGGKAAKTAGTTIHIPTSNYGVAEDIMQMIAHVLAQYIRQSRMNDEQIRSARF